MVDASKINPEADEYELLPHREIEELKEELSKLKEFEIAPSKKLHVSLLELNTKLDKLIMIFEDATHELRMEEGGLSFTEKMRPLLEKMNKILEQNAEIASGILALADIVKEGKGESNVKEDLGLPPMESAPMNDSSFGLPPLPVGRAPPPMSAPMTMGMPPPPPPVPLGNLGFVPPGVPPGEPLAPFPRRRTFGL